MAKSKKSVKDLQDEALRLKKDIWSLDGDDADSLYIRNEMYLLLQKLGGRAPTKRDEIGNVLLYEDPMNEGQQLFRADQMISVDLIKPDYDDDEEAEETYKRLYQIYARRWISTYINVFEMG